MKPRSWLDQFFASVIVVVLVIALAWLISWATHRTPQDPSIGGGCPHVACL